MLLFHAVTLPVRLHVQQRHLGTVVHALPVHSVSQQPGCCQLCDHRMGDVRCAGSRVLQRIEWRGKAAEIVYRLWPCGYAHAQAVCAPVRRPYEACRSSGSASTCSPMACYSGLA
jgi:hypothetical protein